MRKNPRLVAKKTGFSGGSTCILAWFPRNTWFLPLALLVAISLPAKDLGAQTSPLDLQLAFEPDMLVAATDSERAPTESQPNATRPQVAYDVGNGLDVFLHDFRPRFRTPRGARPDAVFPYQFGDRAEVLILSPFVGTPSAHRRMGEQYGAHLPPREPFEDHYSAAAGLEIFLDRGIWASFAYGTSTELPGWDREIDYDGVAFDESERLIFGIHVYY